MTPSERSMKEGREIADSGAWWTETEGFSSDKLAEMFALALDRARAEDRAETIERCAKECEARVDKDGYRYGNREAEQCAIAIRALKEPK